MNAFPAAGDYYKAVQAPGRCFTVPKLQAAEFVWDSLGPTLARGSSAVVFQASVQGRPQALRCYIREDASSRDRYSALDTYLASHDLSPYVSGTTWLDGAITVNRAPWPVLTMDWIDGRTLNEYVDFLVAGSNAAALTTLAGRWRELVALLQRSEFAHGDLQHGNVMVDQDGQLRLVDFDGVWIPQLAGQPPPTEYGHPNYQHPLHHNWDRWLDTFSAPVRAIALATLGPVVQAGNVVTVEASSTVTRVTLPPNALMLDYRQRAIAYRLGAQLRLRRVGTGEDTLLGTFPVKPWQPLLFSTDRAGSASATGATVSWRSGPLG